MKKFFLLCLLATGCAGGSINHTNTTNDTKYELEDGRLEVVATQKFKQITYLKVIVLKDKITGHEYFLTHDGTRINLYPITPK